MTGLTLDQYYEKNISVLCDFCDKYNLPQDYISDTYLSLKNTLIKSGLTEQQYFNYIRKAIWNRFLDDKRRVNFKWVKDVHFHTKYYDDFNTKPFFEETLRDMDEWDDKQYYYELEYLTKYLFKYLQSKPWYSEIEIFIFKTYAISGYTYKEIEKKFGLKQDRCKNTMRKIRYDLRKNFLKYIEDENTKQRRDN